MDSALDTNFIFDETRCALEADHPWGSTSYENDYIKHEGPLPPLPHTESTLSLEKPFEEEPLAYGRHGAAEVDWPMAASSEHTHVPGATQPYDCYAFDPMDVMYSHQPQVQPFAQTPLQFQQDFDVSNLGPQLMVALQQQNNSLGFQPPPLPSMPAYRPPQAQVTLAEHFGLTFNRNNAIQIPQAPPPQAPIAPQSSFMIPEEEDEDWVKGCGQLFKSKRAFSLHSRTHTSPKNESTSRAFICDRDDCGRTFSQKCHLVEHIRSIHDKERPFECQECGKSFTRKSVLNVHMRTHTGERPFPCIICEKRFTTRGALVRHKKIHDRGSGKSVPERLREAACSLMQTTPMLKLKTNVSQLNSTQQLVP